MEAADTAGNRAAQSDEAEVLKSIYGEDCLLHDDHSCKIFVHALEDDGFLPPLCLCAYFPESYPSTSEPIMEMEAPWLQEEPRQKLGEELHRIFQENAGNVIIFTWVEWIKEQNWLWEEARSWKALHSDKLGCKVMDSFTNLDEIKEGAYDESEESAQVPLRNKGKNVLLVKVGEKIGDEPDAKDSEELDKILGITHGAPFTEKRSTFQAHLAHADSVDQVETVMEALLRNRKIAGATHNIMAYRINIPEKGTVNLQLTLFSIILASYSNYDVKKCRVINVWVLLHGTSKQVLQDYDDDGETAAGGRLLHLLQIVDATNVVVVVSRWFGGILLGPDRFKHINNAARSLLNTCGFIKGAGQSGSLGDKQKSQSKASVHKGKRR